MHASFLPRSLLSFIIVSSIPGMAWAADCADRFETTQFDYLGRSADSSKSYWITQSNRADSFRVSAPGVASIDSWQTSGASTHITESTVVKNDANGTHKLDRMKSDGSYDCFLQSRNQTNPLLPPTWRPPAKPERPEVVRPQIPERPVAVRPQIPDRPVAIRPTVPELPVAVRPEIPDFPIVARPQLPDLPVVTRPGAIQIAMNGYSYELSRSQLLQYCPSAVIDAQGQVDDASLQACSGLVAALKAAPLTPGRDLLAPSEWNAWADLQYLHSDNRRGFSPLEGEGSTLSLGADRLLNPELSLGFMLTLSKQNAEAFRGALSSDADSVLAGPYLAYALNSHWSLFANVLAGRVSHDYQLLSLQGDSSATKYSASLNLQGEYALDERNLIRPKFGISYNKEAAKSYQLSGVLLGKSLQVVVDDQRHESGQMQASAEYNTRLQTQQGQVFVPYLEAGVLYNYLQPNQSLNPDWQGLVRAGVRTLAGQSWQLDVSASYQSLGVSKLDVWDCKLFVSHAF